MSTRTSDPTRKVIPLPGVSQQPGTMKAGEVILAKVQSRVIDEVLPDFEAGFDPQDLLDDIVELLNTMMADETSVMYNAANGNLYLTTQSPGGHEYLYACALPVPMTDESVN